MIGKDGFPADLRRTIAEAIEDARDGALDARRREVVRRLLLTDGHARKYYRDYNELSYLLTQADSPQVGRAAAVLSGMRQSKRPFRPQTVKWMTQGRVAAAGSLVAILLTAFAIANVFRRAHEPLRKEARAIAGLEEISGSVSVTNSSAETRAVESSVPIEAGDTVRTRGILSSATMFFPDGTRLLLVGDTSLTAAPAGGKNVVFHQGTMFASVTPQASGRPMLVATPNEKVQVLGTRFTLDVAANATDLSVGEGRVRLTRLRDGHSV